MKRPALIIILFILAGTISEAFAHPAGDISPDTIPGTYQPPDIDGVADDKPWSQTEWSDMAYLWLGQPVDSADFSGRYKILWDADLLYFILEISDDDYVTGYSFSTSNSNPTSWNYDIVEVFIDEDNSGGIHITNNDALAYHIACTIPEDGQSVKDFSAGDWNNSVWTNLYSHINEFALRRAGKKTIWEFSLKIFDKTLVFEQNEDLSRVSLETGKKMGLSIAYCDADGGYGRDSFIGSVGGGNAADHYRNADLFGKIVLGEAPEGSTVHIENTHPSDEIQMRVFPNPCSTGMCSIHFASPSKGEVEVELFSPVGKKLYSKTFWKEDALFRETINLPRNYQGVFICRVNDGKNTFTSNLIIFPIK